MKRLGLLTVALALVSASAPATTAGIVSVAPYTRTVGVAGGSIQAPCTEKASPVQARPNDPATGRIDGTLGIDVTGCALSTHSADETWRVAESPEALIGKRVTVHLVFLFDAAYSHASGTASRAEAAYHLIVNGNDRVVASSTCVDNGCSNYGTVVGPVSFPMGITYASLPASIDMTIRREARVEGGTGTAWVDVTGRLLAVVFRPEL